MVGSIWSGAAVMAIRQRAFAGALAIATLLAPDMAGAAFASELNVYSYRQEFLTKPFIERFERDTGAKVNTVFITRGLLERLKAEGANSPADIVLTADVARLHELAERHLLRAITSPVLDRNIPRQYHGAGGLWYGLTTRARVIYFAKGRVAPEQLSTYEDLAHPKWKGRICTRSGYHIYQLSLLASLIAHNGEEAAETWLRGVKANLARRPQGNDRAQVRAIKEGVCDIALGNTYYMGLMKADPKQRVWADAVTIFFPNQGDRGTHVNISGVAVTRSAKNLTSAVKFVEFLSSEDAQRLYAEQNFEYPVKPGVPRHGEVASWGRFKADDMNLGEVARFQASAVKIVDRVGYDD